MKGPSLDAIRRFKEQQERIKKEQDEKKLKEKFATLEHRASQGDRKAKSDLKKIERLEEKKKQINETLANNGHNSNRPTNPRQIQSNQSSSVKIKPKSVEVDFDKLMEMAKQNNNQIKRPNEPKEKPVPIIAKKPRCENPPPQPTRIKNQKSIAQDTSHHLNNRRETSQSIVQRPSLKHSEIKPPMRNNHQIASSNGSRLQNVRKKSQEELENERKMLAKRAVARHLAAARRQYYEDDDDYYDEDDGSEMDDFVVDEDEDDVQDEVSKTIKSVFKYDKNRCDRREQELDRQYRLIGKVSTFEDLEREERRASRIAAAEDAKEQRLEDERKRLKAMRTNKYK